MLIIPIIIVVDVVDAEEDNINKKVDNKWQIIMLPFNIRFYYCIEKYTTKAGYIKLYIFAKSIFLHREILQKYYKNIKIILRKDNVLFLIRKCCKIKKIVIVVNTREEYEKWQ